MCPYFLMGKCTKGTKCSFAHTKEEVREQPNLRKTKLCKEYTTGKCCNQDCPFAHGEEELKATPDFYKTSICSSFLDGKCKFGDKCRYAHGKDELRITGKNKRKFKKSCTVAQNTKDEINKAADFKHSVSSVVNMVDKEINCMQNSNDQAKMAPLEQQMNSFHIIAPIQKLSTLESLLKQESFSTAQSKQFPYVNSKSMISSPPPGFSQSSHQPSSHFLPFFKYPSQSNNQVYKKQTSNSTQDYEMWGTGFQCMPCGEMSSKKI